MSNGLCPNCMPSHTVYKVICEHGRVFPFYTMNPYLIFNQHPSLNIDHASLDQAYFALQRLLHPDKIRNVSGQEKEWAEQHIGQINKAYKALQSTLLIAKSAAMYIQDPLKELESFNDRDIPVLDSYFLNKILVLQMNAVPNDIDELFNKIISDLDNAIKQLSLKDILHAIARLTYVERLRNLIQEI